MALFHLCYALLKEHMELLNTLRWRYATKAMNGQLVEQDKIEAILEAIRLAPTSSGLQPFEVIIVTDPEVKKKIRAVAANQSVVEDCSHLLVFAAWDNYTESRINAYFEEMVKQRGFDERMDNYRKFLLGNYTGRPAGLNYEHAARQAYIAFGIAIVAAAEQRLDATPMEGFDPAGVDEILNLKERGLKSVTLLPVGFRDEGNDWMVNVPKVRKPKEQLFSFVK